MQGQGAHGRHHARAADRGYLHRAQDRPLDRRPRAKEEPIPPRTAIHNRPCRRGDGGGMAVVRSSDPDHASLHGHPPLPVQAIFREVALHGQPRLGAGRPGLRARLSPALRTRVRTRLAPGRHGDHRPRTHLGRIAAGLSARGQRTAPLTNPPRATWGPDLRPSERTDTYTCAPEGRTANHTPSRFSPAVCPGVRSPEKR